MIHRITEPKNMRPTYPHTLIAPLICTVIGTLGIFLYFTSAIAEPFAGGTEAQAALARGDFATVLQLWRQAADKGDARAQANLGFLYHEGQGVPQDDAEALKWYRLAAGQGDASAQQALGSLYREGRGVPQDLAEAIKWTRLAADQGDAHAQYDLGVMYHDGKDVKQDYPEALKWFGKAAEQGQAKAQFFAASIYFEGNSATRDLQSARRLYGLAAKNLPPGELRDTAQTRVGLLLQVDKTTRKAEAGDTESQYALAVLFGAKDTLLLDYRESAKWLAMAAD